ncbi:MAG: pantoate--beta-alanine ligase [Prolixibacteraceae bacterium]|jgi:pantoate--beta-alanine ligase|nr:pantoate--beta-alanine ligase [Prolixibacteraceae bacterium]
MNLICTIAELEQAIDIQKQAGRIVGFVPTMGALHQGHLMLVNNAGEECDVVVVSIFVNPTQFNNNEDLQRYPRTLESDMRLLKSTPCSIVFAPSAEEVYPEEDTRVFQFGNIGSVMEGKYRPGHFNGVAQVVSKLFDMVKPHKAYFGLKDFQQLAIINSMVDQLKIPVEIIPCPIVRESDGLAMSSRNALLEPIERDNAALISKTLFEAQKKKKMYSVNELKKWVVGTIDTNSFLKTEYFDIVDDRELKSITSWEQKVNKVACIAVHCGKVRLIDNIIL